MANTCKTCQHPDIDRINGLLVQGVALRSIEAETGISNVSIYRHKEKCIDALFAEVREQRRTGLLADVDELKAEIDEVKADFPTNGNVRTQLIARRKEAIELEAKLTGAFIKDAPNPKGIDQIVAAFTDRLKAKGYPVEEIPAAVAEYRASLEGVKDEMGGGVS